MTEDNQSTLFTLENITLDRLTKLDIEEATALVARTMNSIEGLFAEQSLRFHFQCRESEIDDGRELYAWRTKGRIAGLAGLHHYNWGPPENVWLSWLAVDRAYRRKGIGRCLVEKICSIAITKGYSKVYIETYSSETFSDARAFYKATGFSEVGRIPDYMPDEADMVVYFKPIEPEKQDTDQYGQSYCKKPPAPNHREGSVLRHRDSTRRNRYSKPTGPHTAGTH